MILEEGEVIKLNTNGKDYVVLKKVNCNNTNSYYLMTLNKPTEVLVVKYQLIVKMNQLLLQLLIKMN